MIHHVESVSDYRNLVKKHTCIVKFTASWCNPCKKIAPTFTELESKYGNILKFIEVDVDSCEKVPDLENIKSVPQFVFYSEGKKREELGISGVNPLTLTKNVERLVKEHNEKPVVVEVGDPSKDLEKLILDEESDISDDDN